MTGTSSSAEVLSTPVDVISSSSRSKSRLQNLGKKMFPARARTLLERGEAYQVDTHKLLEEDWEGFAREHQDRLRGEYNRLQKEGLKLKSRGRVLSFLFRGQEFQWNLDTERLRSKTTITSFQVRIDKARRVKTDSQDPIDLISAQISDQNIDHSTAHASSYVDADDQGLNAQAIAQTASDNTSRTAPPRAVTYAKLSTDLRLTDSVDQETLECMLEHYIDTVAHREGRIQLLAATGSAAQGVVDIIDTCIFYGIQQQEKLSFLRRQSIQLVRALCRDNGIYPLSALLNPDEVQKIGEKEVASGSFGIVWEGTYGDRPVALKEIPGVDVDKNSEELKKFCKEAAVWKYLQHENITRFYGVCVDRTPVCLVSAWMTNGTIIDYLERNHAANRLDLVRDGGMHWAVADLTSFKIAGVVNGLVYMHELGIVHGDLKGDNILVNENGIASLADFGLSAFSHDEQSRTISATSHKEGTLRYSAPEVQDWSGINGPSFESDVYSFAMTTWEIFTGRRPYFDIKKPGPLYVIVVMDKIRPQRPRQATGLGLYDEIWSVMERCWTHEPQDRPPMTSVRVELKTIRAQHDPESLETPASWPLQTPPTPTSRDAASTQP
ncbi:kinase-like protein [Obba rivulosa]|uniref:Kinase-like protein n=1 Tax=Obba rivulosa TaxID=1052685 RepID=A0A8E2DIL0_9APHY|nr:kinase-like protein [Obba rivulosa]